MPSMLVNAKPKAIEIITTASRIRKTAAASSPAAAPLSLRLTLISDLASWISSRTSVERSLVVSATSRPIVGLFRQVGTVWSPCLSSRNLSGRLTRLLHVASPTLRRQAGPRDWWCRLRRRSSTAADTPATTDPTSTAVFACSLLDTREGQIGDQQRHGEADPGQHGDPEDVAPADLRCQLGPGEPASPSRRRASTPMVLPTTSPSTMPEHDRVLEQFLAAADGDAGRHQGEERHRDAGRDRADPVLEPLGRRLVLVGVGPDPSQQSEGDTGDRRVHAALVQQPPARERQAVRRSASWSPASAAEPHRPPSRRSSRRASCTRSCR